MNPFELEFHHLGLAVRRGSEAVAFLQGLGYRIGKAMFDPEQNVNLIMCTHAGMPNVEVIYPAMGKSPVDELVARNPNGLVYHACYVAHDLEVSLARMEQAGIRAVCVSPPKPAVLFGGRQVSFYNIVGMGLVEILAADDSRPERPNEAYIAQC